MATTVKTTSFTRPSKAGEVGRVLDLVRDRKNLHRDAQLDCRRQHEAAAVVGVLADQADPTRSAKGVHSPSPDAARTSSAYRRALAFNVRRWVG